MLTLDPRSVNYLFVTYSQMHGENSQGSRFSCFLTEGEITMRFNYNSSHCAIELKRCDAVRKMIGRGVSHAFKYLLFLPGGGPSFGMESRGKGSLP
jgi:hypothetical protein